MLIMRSSDIRPSAITPKDAYFNRREFFALAAGLALAAGAAAPRGRKNLLHEEPILDG